jgi:hypothetical protein
MKSNYLIKPNPNHPSADIPEGVFEDCRLTLSGFRGDLARAQARLRETMEEACRLLPAEILNALSYQAKTYMEQLDFWSTYQSKGIEPASDGIDLNPRLTSMDAELKIEALDLTQIPEDLRERIARQTEYRRSIKHLERIYDEEQVRIASACSFVAPPQDAASAQ